jgi:acetyl-CoA carboxylase biotin carboxyl carrier protein
MAGKVVQVCVAAGDAVAEDQDLIVIESMKMQIPVGSPEEGTVVKVHVTADQFLNEGDVIVDLE